MGSSAKSISTTLCVLFLMCVLQRTKGGEASRTRASQTLWPADLARGTNMPQGKNGAPVFRSKNSRVCRIDIVPSCRVSCALAFVPLLPPHHSPQICVLGIESVLGAPPSSSFLQQPPQMRGRVQDPLFRFDVKLRPWCGVSSEGFPARHHRHHRSPDSVTGGPMLEHTPHQCRYIGAVQRRSTPKAPARLIHWVATPPYRAARHFWPGDDNSSAGCIA